MWLLDMPLIQYYKYLEKSVKKAWGLPELTFRASFPFKMRENTLKLQSTLCTCTLQIVDICVSRGKTVFK